MVVGIEQTERSFGMFNFDVRSRSWRGEDGSYQDWDGSEGEDDGTEAEDSDARSLWEAEMAAIWESKRGRRG
jgi:hypothetical protein